MAVTAASLAASGCDRTLDTGPLTEAGPPQLVAPNPAVAATVGVPFSYDATRNGAAFSDPRGGGLTYSIALAPPSLGLTATGGRVSGLPAAPGVVNVTIMATDRAGQSASQTFPVAIFAVGLRAPSLPPTPFAYSDGSAPLPPHFLNGPGAPVISTDNTPVVNPTTDAGATLGRVLFYDRRLSKNDNVACASCHLQSRGFGDSARLSLGVAGRTTRHAPALANARFYQRGRAFWDERASSLEDQALRPIQDPVEMGLTLDQLLAKLRATSFYAPLFNAAFGTPEITTDRLSRAIAQFVRSLRSASARFDGSFPPPGGVAATPLSPLEQQGQQLFNGPAGCAACHTTNAQVSDNVHNTGLDSVITDVGAGNGRFKAPSLRNVAVRPPFMHDGRFTTLQQVVQFYDSSVRANPGLDPRLRNTDGTPKRLGLTQTQRDALVAFLQALTDSTLLTAPKFANPFP